MIAIKVQNLSKSFTINKSGEKTLKGSFISFLKGRTSIREKFWAAKNIGFEIKKGEFVGIIGENGSGKSTLLKLLTGILYPDSGTIETDGTISSLLELGSGFHPELTGIENIYLNGSILGLSKKEIDRKFAEIVDFSELKDFINNPVRTYSSGMFVRLGFSVAVCVNPEILLMDEVFAVGDEHFVRKCYDRIEKFRANKKTIVLVTHDLSSVEKWCDRALWLHHGKLLEDGLPRYVIDRYRAKIQGVESAEMLEAQKKEVVKIEADTTKKLRWGDKSVEITGVRMFGPDGAERYIFTPEDPIKIEFGIKPGPSAIKNDIVYGIGIFRTDGIVCYGTNTLIDGIKSIVPTGKTIVMVMLERAGLLPGEYTLDAAAHSTDGIAYDYWRGAAKFSVRSPIQDVGVYRPVHKWKILSGDDNGK